MTAAAGCWDAAVGRSHSLSRTFTAEDLTAYDALVGDTGDGREVPEPLVAGLFSALLGVHLPGPGTNYLKQSLRPAAPAVPGERLDARVEVVRVVPAKRLVYLLTTCHGEDGRLVADGEALVLAGGWPEP